MSQTEDTDAPLMPGLPEIPASEPAPSRRVRLGRILRSVYLAALIAAVVIVAVLNRSEIAELLEDARPAMVVAALLATFPLLALGARIWVTSLQMLGHPVKLPAVVMATTRALPARYVPLKLSFSVGRVALLRAGGMALGPLMATAALEMAISAAVALGLGTALLGISGALPGGLAWPTAALAVAAVGASPAVGGKILAFLAARRSITLTMTWAGYFRLLAAATVYWAWACGAFVLYMRAFPAADSYGILEMSGAFMVAWAVGFLAVFAPQGFGVSELSLTAMLPNEEVAGIAMAVVFGGYRLVQLARDMAAASIAEVIATRRARRGSPPSG